MMLEVVQHQARKCTPFAPDSSVVASTPYPLALSKRLLHNSDAGTMLRGMHESGCHRQGSGRQCFRGYRDHVSIKMGLIADPGQKSRVWLCLTCDCQGRPEPSRGCFIAPAANEAAVCALRSSRTLLRTRHTPLLCHAQSGLQDTCGTSRNNPGGSSRLRYDWLSLDSWVGSLLQAP